MSDYRTDEQFHEIMESIGNGNWTQGANEVIEYGFYAHDLVNKIWEFPEYNYEMQDLVYLIETATKLREQN